MSSEAISFTLKHGPSSGLKGNHLLVVLVMAHKSNQRRAPFFASVGAPVIAASIGVTERYVRQLVSELMESGHLDLITKGSGPLPNLYQFGKKGVNYRSLLGVNSSSRVKELPTEETLKRRTPRAVTSYNEPLSRTA